ncbi:MAG: hypothetical protein ABIF18_01385 [archaeon]
MAINKDNYFYASDGIVLKTQNDMLDFLKNVDNQTFENYVNCDKNDFANWTRDILKKKQLAKKLEKTKNKDEMITAIEEQMKSKSKGSKKTIISKIVEAMTND